MNIAFLDLKAQFRHLEGEIRSRMEKVLASAQFILGPEVEQLEKELADFAGVRRAIGCASGTDALLMGLMAYGVGPGDGVITTPFTFVATAEAIALLGATPIFVDIDPLTFNIDPKQVERVLTALERNDPACHPLPLQALACRGSGTGQAAARETETRGLKVKGIAPVDIFGLPYDFDALSAIADAHGLFLLEDAAQGFGATYKGRPAGSLGHIAATSFFPSKPLGCYGDGGAVFTDDDDLADLLLSIRVHGQGSHKYENVRLGINGRLDALQAAVLLAKLPAFPGELEARRRVAGMYTDLLSGCAGLRTPHVPDGFTSAWAQYSLLCSGTGNGGCAGDGDGAHGGGNGERERGERGGPGRRDAILASLKDAGVPTMVYYPVPLHLQTAFSYLGYRTGDFPVSEDCAGRIFSIPMHPYLREEEVRFIADTLIRTVSGPGA